MWIPQIAFIVAQNQSTQAVLFFMLLMFCRSRRAIPLYDYRAIQPVACYGENSPDVSLSTAFESCPTSITPVQLIYFSVARPDGKRASSLWYYNKAPVIVGFTQPRHRSLDVQCKGSG